MLQSTPAGTSSIDGVIVRDAMCPGVVTCPPNDGVKAVASIMTTRGIHAVVVSPIALPNPPIVTDLELARAGLERPDARALDIARDPVDVMAAAAPLMEAISIMAERGVAHVLVVEEDSTFAGILSSFDVVALVGGHNPRYARTQRPAPARPSPSATSLNTARVFDAMHRGVVTCNAGASLQSVAQSMAEYRVHCIVVTGLAPGEPAPPWGLISDMDLIAAAERGSLDARASAIAATTPITVAPSDTLETAAALMVEHHVSHVVVADETGLPSGMISTLDVASTVAAPA